MAAKEKLSEASSLLSSSSTTRSNSVASDDYTNSQINAAKGLVNGLFGSKIQSRSIPQGKSSFLGAVFVVTNAAMGAGLLSYPYSFYLAGGWYWGLLIEFVLLPAIIGSLIILAYCSELKQTVTCEETLGEMLGPVARLITEILVCVYCFGCCVTLLVVMGDQLEDVTSAFTYHGRSLSDQWWASRKFLIPIATIILIYPWLFLKKIGILSYTSFLGIISCVYICAVIFVKYFIKDNPLDCTAPKYFYSNDCSRSWTSVFNSVPFVCFAFQCHVSSIPVYSGLKKRTVKRFFFIALAAVGICTFIYSVSGIFAYMTFIPIGSCLNSDIIRNYCPNDVPVSIARGMLFLCLITSYPILAFCGRVSLDGLVSRFSFLYKLCKKRKSGPLNKNDKDTSLSCHKGCPLFCSYDLIQRLINIHLWLLGSLALALFVTEIKEIVSPLGSLAAVFVFVLPGLCLLSLSLQFHFNGVLKNVFGLIVSVSFISFGTFILIDDLIYNVIEQIN